MAEAIFNSLAKTWRAESAGIEKAERVDKIVRKLLSEKGLKAKEKPRTVHEIDLNNYDLVVTVCEESKCIVLPAKNLESWDIEDPAGKNENVYRSVYREIEEKVKVLVERLEQKI